MHDPVNFTPADLEAARLALAEYNAAYEQGGELEYPMWAEAILKRAKSTRKEAV